MSPSNAQIIKSILSIFLSQKNEKKKYFYDRQDPLWFFLPSLSPAVINRLKKAKTMKNWLKPTIENLIYTHLHSYTIFDFETFISNSISIYNLEIEVRDNLKVVKKLRFLLFFSLISLTFIVCFHFTVNWNILPLNWRIDVYKISLLWDLRDSVLFESFIFRFCQLCGGPKRQNLNAVTKYNIKRDIWKI